MKLHEYQARDLLQEYGISVPPGRVAENPEQAAMIARELGGRVVVKAQVLVGGRGKAGGIKLASTPEEAREKAEEILALRIKDLPVNKVLVTAAVAIQKEYYLGLTVDRGRKQVVCIMSAAGGVDIEDLAKKEPGKILTLPIDPQKSPQAIRESRGKALESFLATAMPEALVVETAETVLNMYRLLKDKDCSLVEINPFVQVEDGSLIAADAKILFDDNGLIKHPELEQLRNAEEYSHDEIRAREAGLSFVSLDGDIGCIVNGAGLAMATMDQIKLFGGSPANFLDVGGSSNPQKVLTALEILLNNSELKAILINIFGGITRCDDIARGILLAMEQIEIPVPLVIRLIGTNEKEGREILSSAGLVAAEEMSAAVKMVIERAHGES